MKILSVNAGSSSLRLKLYDVVNNNQLITALFERIGFNDSFYSIEVENKKKEKRINFDNHDDAVAIFFNELVELKIIKGLEEIKAVGHRIVHGGDKYFKSTIINDEVVADIEKFNELAPLHNPPSLLGIKAIRKLLPNVTAIAVFDTSFYQSMTKDAYIYAVPYQWYTDYGIRKYGFHGISHKYIAERTATLLDDDNLKIISCHLGNGASITAIDKGKAIDTSLGFTPIAGIAMGTRCGDIDVSIISYLMKKTGKSIDEIMEDLNEKSGLLGISGISSDLREIEEEITKGNERCLLAIKIYINRIISFISYYNIILGGADVIVFTAGIGENSISVRQQIIEQLEPLGVIIDKEMNELGKKEKLISAPHSKIKCYVIPTDEELMISKEVNMFLK